MNIHKSSNICSEEEHQQLKQHCKWDRWRQQTYSVCTAAVIVDIVSISLIVFVSNACFLFLFSMFLDLKPLTWRSPKRCVGSGYSWKELAPKKQAPRVVRGISKAAKRTHQLIESCRIVLSHIVLRIVHGEATTLVMASVLGTTIQTISMSNLFSILVSTLRGHNVHYNCAERYRSMCYDIFRKQSPIGIRWQLCRFLGMYDR